MFAVKYNSRDILLSFAKALDAILVERENTQCMFLGRSKKVNIMKKRNEYSFLHKVVQGLTIEELKIFISIIFGIPSPLQMKIEFYLLQK